MNRKLLLLFVLLLLIKSILLIVDHEPSFFFGDSLSYLFTAVSHTIPYDRSFLYGFVLRPLLERSHSLRPVLIFQATLSCLAAWIAGMCLLRYFRIPFLAAACCAIGCALEPFQLMSERFMMTETVSTFGFAVYFWACCSYLETGSLPALAASAAVGVFIVGIRFSFLPVLVILSLLLPLLSWQALGYRRVATHLLVAILLSQGLLFGYRHWYGYLAHEPAEYLSRDGDFLVADVAPIVKPVDFPLADKRNEVFEKLGFPLNNPDNRRVQRWMPGGLCDAILRSAGNDEDAANRLARKTALRAIKRDPLGLLKLALFTYREFFNTDQLKWALQLNQGQFNDADSSGVRFLQSRFGIDTSHRRFDSLTKRWEEISAPWCWFLVISPLLYTAYLAVQGRRSSPAHWICAICSLLFLVSAVTATEFANPRYLNPLTWLVFVMIGSTMSLCGPRSKPFER